MSRGGEIWLDTQRSERCGDYSMWVRIPPSAQFYAKI